MSARALGAVITAFHPGRNVVELASVLTAEGVQCVVVDNTPGPQGPVVAEVAAMHGVTVVRMGANRGLAHALNVGLTRLRSLACGVATLWDQDSLPEPGYGAALAAMCSEARTGGRAVVVAGTERPWAGSGEALVPGPDQEVTALITSGMTAELEVFDRVGPFREDFFLDMVDLDFGLRARAAGVRLVRTARSSFLHELGDTSRARRVVGTKLFSSGHPPWRQYWVARNSVVLVREHARTDPAAAGHLALAQVDWFGRALLAGPHRRRTLRAALRGWSDAVRGRTAERYSPFD